jgi:tetratricopeptide (TPR) repeat protein
MRFQVVTLVVLLWLYNATLGMAQNGQALRQQGLIQLDRGDTQGAIQTFNRILSGYSNDRKLIAQTLLQLGDTYQSLNEPVQARTYYERIISQYSDQPQLVASARTRAAALAEVTSVPEGWMLEGNRSNDYETSVDRGTVLGGLASYYIRSKNPQPAAADFGTLMRTLSAKSYLGKRLRFSALVKTENVQQYAGLWMRIDGKSPASGGSMMLAFDNMADRPIKGTVPWRSYEVVLDVPADASTVNYGVLLHGTGVVWLNDPKLEEVGVGVDVTGSLRRPPQLGANPDLEQWGKSGIQPDAYDLRIEKDPSGRPVARLAANQIPRQGGFATYTKTYDAQMYLRKRVRFSALFKSENVLQFSGLWMRTDFAGGMLALANMADRPVKGTTDWQRYEVVLEVPSVADVIILGIQLIGPGSVWITDPRFEEVQVDR